MTTTLFSTLAITGRISLWNLDCPGGMIRCHNLVTYQGADIIAALLAGQADRRIAAIWFEYTNAGGPASIAPGRADTAASVIAAAFSTAGSSLWLRALKVKLKYLFSE